MGSPDARPSSRYARERRGGSSLGPPPPTAARRAGAPEAGWRGGVHEPAREPGGRPPPVQAHRQSRTPWSHSRRASGPAPHAHRAPCCWPPFFRARRLVVRPDAGAIEKRHAKLDASLLGQEQKPLPHAQVGPADEHLSRPRPGPQVSRDGAPLGPVLMPPDNGRKRAPQILGRGLALGPARLNQRLQVHPGSVRQPPSVSIAPPPIRRSKTPVITTSSSANRP